MASPFNLDSANASRNYDYVRAGRYLVRLEEFRFGVNRAKIDYARFSFTVVSVLDPSEAAKDPKGPHRVGEKISWVLMANKDASAPNLKAALMSIMEAPAEEITDDFSKTAASDAQPLKGMFLVLDGSLQKMKSKEGVFTRISIKRRVLGVEVKKIVPQEVLQSLRLTDISDDE